MAEITDEFLWKLVERAGSLRERLSGSFLSVPSSVPVPSGAAPAAEAAPASPVAERVVRWQKSAGGQTGWERLTEWDSLDLAGLSAALDNVRPASATLPGWAVTLREILSSPQDRVDTATAGTPDLPESNPLPFEELLEPFVDRGRQQLAARFPRHAEVFSPEAAAALELHLRVNLIQLASLAFLTEFKVFCTRRQIFRLFQAAPTPTPSTEDAAEKRGDNTPPAAPLEDKLYKAFVKQLQDDHYRAFFLEYSVLARMLVLATENWTAFIAEFGERLARDLAAIAREFGDGQEPGRLAQADAGLSDPHNHGRGVIRLKFESGLKLVYKPKDLRLEATFQQFLGWFNTATASSGELLPFKTIGVLLGKDYGWVEYVEQLPCQDEAGLTRYYRRLGMLLSLVHALNGTDCHYENVIASGEHPVLVDTETLLHPRVPFIFSAPAEAAESGITGEKEDKAEERARVILMGRTLDESVLRTAMLPLGTLNREDTDFSAFAAIGEQLTSYHVPQWENVNTDSMRVVYEKATVSASQNVPALEGFTLDLSRHAADLIAGFEEMYRYLLANREVLLDESDGGESPLPRFAALPGRFIFRNTRVYGLLLHYANQPVYLREGAERSLHFEKLSRAFILDTAKPAYWPLLAAERQSLEELDIPLFNCDTSSNELAWSGQSLVRDWFIASGYQAVRDRLGEMGEVDLARQQAIIREALRSSFAGEPFDAEKITD